MSCEETKQQAEPSSYPLFPGEDQLQVCTKAELGYCEPRGWWCAASPLVSHHLPIASTLPPGIGPGKGYIYVAHCGHGHLVDRDPSEVAVAASWAEEQQFAAVCVHMEMLFTVSKVSYSLSVLGVGHGGAQARWRLTEGNCKALQLYAKQARRHTIFCLLFQVGWSWVVSTLVLCLCIRCGCVSAVSGSMCSQCCVNGSASLLAISVPSRRVSGLCAWVPAFWMYAWGEQCTSKPLVPVCNDWRIKTGGGMVKIFLDTFCPCILLLCCPPQFSACFASYRIYNNAAVILCLIKSSINILQFSFKAWSCCK